MTPKLPVSLKSFWFETLRVAEELQKRRECLWPHGFDLVEQL